MRNTHRLPGRFSPGFPLARRAVIGSPSRCRCWRWALLLAAGRLCQCTNAMPLPLAHFAAAQVGWRDGEEARDMLHACPGADGRSLFHRTLLSRHRPPRKASLLAVLT